MVVANWRMPNTRWRHHSPQPVSSTFISTTFGREPRCSRRLSKAGPARVGSATRAGPTCLGPARLRFEPCVAHPPPCRGTLPAGVPYAIGESRPDCCCNLARPLARPPPARPRRRGARGRPAAAKSDSTIGASIMRWSTRTPPARDKTARSAGGKLSFPVAATQQHCRYATPVMSCVLASLSHPRNE